jgi:hypothetical protein
MDTDRQRAGRSDGHDRRGCHSIHAALAAVEGRLAVNPPKLTHTLREKSHTLTRAALALLVLALAASVAPSLAGRRGPDLSGVEELTVPAGNKVSYHVYAEGVQIYRWNGTSWAFVGPEAVLYADDPAEADGDGVVGIHYAGPTWESNSGSVVVAAVEKRATPDPDAIPWLRLKATSNDGPGIFDRVTYIQRVNTTGGIAPAAPGDFLGEEARVPYTAEYYFYRAQR